MQAIIFAGGAFPHRDTVSRCLAAFPDKDRLIIAADRGLECAVSAGLQVDLLVGDLDSLTPGILEALQDKPALAPKEIKRFPPQKDESDLELSVRLAWERRADSCLILGALGGRLDHELFNAISLLDLCRQLHLPATLADDQSYLTLWEPGEYSPGQYLNWIFSIIPLDSGITLSLQGFRYEVEDCPLPRACTRGLSNVITSPQALASIKKGPALVIITRPEA